MFWKESHKSESFKLPKFLQQICQSNLGKDFNRVMSSRGVKSDKKENILKMLRPHMKERSRSFGIAWRSIMLISLMNETNVNIVEKHFVEVSGNFLNL